MKKRIILFLALTLVFSCFCTLGAAAAYEDGPSVRVNGRLVEFPDGQPYIDAHDRTLIPVRFVAEELGADVSWDGKTRTAIIKRGGVEVDITIGNSVLTVKRDGVTDKVTMDTEAVLAHDRTYVPIRFVAEQLGAFVDYADYYRTVGIYNDVLSKEEIERLSSYPLDAVCNTGTPLPRYALVDGRNSTFANCRELEWSDNNGAFHNSQKTLDEAISEMNYHSDNLDIEFRTDASCFYNIRPIDDEYGYLKAGRPSVRGVISMTRKGEYTQTDFEKYWEITSLFREGAGAAANIELPLGETVTLDVEGKFTENVYHKDYDSVLYLWVLNDPGHHVTTETR